MVRRARADLKRCATDDFLGIGAEQFVGLFFPDQAYEPLDSGSELWPAVFPCRVGIAGHYVYKIRFQKALGGLLGQAAEAPQKGCRCDLHEAALLDKLSQSSRLAGDFDVSLRVGQDRRNIPHCKLKEQVVYARNALDRKLKEHVLAAIGQGQCVAGIEAVEQFQMESDFGAGKNFQIDSLLLAGVGKQPGGKGSLTTMAPISPGAVGLPASSMTSIR